MEIQQFVPVEVSQIAELENENKELRLTVDAFDEAICELETERHAQELQIRRVIDDLATLPEVPLNMLEASIDSIIDALKAAL